MDYIEIISSMVKPTSIRVLLSIVISKDLELKQLDVKTIFLYGKLKEHIFMNQLYGFEAHMKEDLVCLLKRSLYGLK